MSSIGRLARLTGNWIPAALARPFGKPTAVFFHGIEQKISDPFVQVNQHALDAFEHLARLLKRDFDVLPLTAITDVMKAPAKHSRALFLMSDDGYANLLTNAAPVLKSFALPWTLFVSTHHVDTGEWSPPTLNRLFYLEAPEGIYDIPHLGSIAISGGRETRESLAAQGWKQLRALAAPRGDEAIAAMTKILERCCSDYKNRYASENFLTWDQVKSLHRDGVEIGAHADRHWPMQEGQLKSWLREQAIRPKRRIEREIGRCRFFAYPFGSRGDVGQAAREAVRDAGYDFAFTTLAGTIDTTMNPWLLPRYGLAPQESNLAALLPVLRANNGRVRHWQSLIGT